MSLAQKRSLCVVEQELIKAFSEDGRVESCTLPFKVSNILSIPGGLILERSISQPDTEQQKRFLWVICCFYAITLSS